MLKQSGLGTFNYIDKIKKFLGRLLVSCCSYEKKDFNLEKRTIHNIGSPSLIRVSLAIQSEGTVIVCTAEGLFRGHHYTSVARSKNSIPIMDKTASYVHVLRPYGRDPDAHKVHLLLRQVDVRSNYYACHAGMRNWKMTRNVCITLSQMFTLGSRNRRGRSCRSPRLSPSSRRVVGALFASSPAVLAADLFFLERARARSVY